MSRIKETRYWSSDLRSQGKAFHENHLRRCLKSPEDWAGLISCLMKARTLNPSKHLGVASFEQYKKLFDSLDGDTSRYVGEASPDYFWSRVAAERIKKFNPASRILVMLRHPVDYIVSIHRESFSGRLGETIGSLEKALRLEDARANGKKLPCSARYPYSVLYRRQALFDEHCKRILNHFPSDQVHFVALEDLAEHPKQTMSRVYSFLGLEEPGVSLDASPKNVAPEKSKGELTQATIDWLERELRPSVKRLSQLTEIDFLSRWGM